MDLTVVVPCLDEESRLPRSLTAALAYLEATGREYELVLRRPPFGNRVKSVGQAV